ncbi:MAG TPA: hypothetical protein VGM05_19700 [Planctomycetaceae bacterium]|jgi:hypothetical protein
MPPLPLLTFPGVDLVRSWSFTLSHGIFPSAALVEIAPQFDIPAEVGTMVLSFGDVAMEFPGCVLDSATVRRDGAGMIVSLAILDRRWAWRFGQISGRYNMRDQTGALDPDTEQSPQELATLLFAALGETEFDVSLLPDETRPAVDWVYANPAAELSRLAESLGCRVVLGLDGAVSLQPAGQGADLPETGTERTQSFGIDPPSRPDSLLVVCGPTRFETMFRLEAVGQEPTGEIERIDDLSYAPAEGWSSEAWLGFANVADANARAKARQTVFRWYRLKCTAPQNTAGEFQIAGYDGDVSDLWQLLPLEHTRLVTSADVDGIQRPEPAGVSGIFWDRSLDGQDLPAQRQYTGAFTLDVARGIVKFAEPVMKMNPGGASGLVEAELYLTVAHGVRDATTRQPVRSVTQRELPGEGFGTGPEVLRREDLANTIVTNYDSSNNPTDTTDNADELDTEIEAQLDAAEGAYETRITDFVEYAGIVPINPDGAISQIQWLAGAGGAVTRASRNNEFSLSVPVRRNPPVGSF